jgi:REP element-mobilizing transposase RayT
MSRYFVPDSWYFVTVPTRGHRPAFESFERRELLRRRLEESFGRFDVGYPDYAVMADHYHFVGSFRKSDKLPKLLQWVNGGVSFLLRKESDLDLPLWGEYHVFVPKTEEMLDRVRGYVVGNTLKHGDVANESELRRWPFSTYGRLVGRDGDVYAKDIVSSVMSVDDGEFGSARQSPRD